MSLINDALKRAKEAQSQGEQSSPPNLKFRSVGPLEVPPAKSSWIKPSLITAAILILLFVLWQWSQNGKSQRSAIPTAPQTRASAATQATRPAGSAFLPGPSLQVHARGNESGPAKLVATASPRPAGSHPATEMIGVVAVSSTTVVETTNLTSLTELPPKPSGPRLQAILFSPSNPSAIISGKTVFVGDKLGDLRVAAIAKDSATLVGTGRTNILTLP